MRIFKIFLLVIPILLSSPGQVAEKKQADLLPEHLALFMNKVKAHSTFSYSFSQENFNLTTGQTIRAQGTVVFKSPDKFRWDYTSQPPNILASNGETLFMILPEDRQALIQSTATTPELWSPLEILTRPDQLQTNFKVESADSSVKSIAAYRLLPKTPEKFFDYLLLTCNPNSAGADFSLTIFDLAGNRNMLDFTNYTAITNPPAFTPDVPGGFETMDFSGQPIAYTNQVSDQKRGLQP